MQYTCALACAFLALSLGVGPASGDTFDRPVTEIRIDDEGVYHAGFMYWYGTQTLFSQPAEFVVLGEVVRVAQIPRQSGLGAGTAHGRLRVDEVVVCPDSLRKDAERIRFLDADAFDGLAVGDTVLVFMVRYEGEYAIPSWAHADTPIGHRLHPTKDDPFCDDLRFVQLLKSGHAWDLAALSSDELRLWRCVDSDGLLGAFIEAKMIREANSRKRE